ncbi:hypothetical protein D3C72_1605190 [compost metagenome]
MLEDRVTVAKSALGGVQAEALAIGQVHGVQRIEAVLQLDAVGANVLHGRGTCGTRDQRQVFQPGVALLQAPGHHVVPDLARPDLDDVVPVRFGNQALAHDLHLEDGRLHIAGDDDVASAPQHHHLAARAQRRAVQKLTDILFGLHAHQIHGAGHDAKGVVLLQRGIFLD